MKRAPTDPNPPYGEKGAFRKITVTVPPDVYEKLVRESARRKIAGESNQLISALLREAVYKYLEWLG
jgi:transcriptional regulator of met regulon